MNKAHAWDHTGYKAPFKVTGFFSIPSNDFAMSNPSGYQFLMASMPKNCKLGSCAVCSSPLVHNYIITDANGKNFSVGSECVTKVDKYLQADAKKVRRTQEDYHEAALKALATKDRLNAERAANGGLTNDELAAKKAQEARDAFRNTHKEMFDWVEKSGHSVAIQIAGDCIRHCAMSERQFDFLACVAKEAYDSQFFKNEHYGTVGTKVTKTLTTIRDFAIDSRFGMKWIVILRDEEGREYKYVGNAKAVPRLGNSAALTFLVENHDEYKGTKQTIIKRPALAKG